MDTPLCKREEHNCLAGHIAPLHNASTVKKERMHMLHVIIAGLCHTLNILFHLILIKTPWHGLCGKVFFKVEETELKDYVRGSVTQQNLSTPEPTY
jgi:hypothetical protein